MSLVRLDSLGCAFIELHLFNRIFKYIFLPFVMCQRTYDGRDDKAAVILNVRS